MAENLSFLPNIEKGLNKPKQHFKQSNIISRGRRKGFSLDGQRVMAALVAAIREQNISEEISISVNACFISLADIDAGGKTYQKFKMTVKEMSQCSVELPEEDNAFTFVPVFHFITYRNGLIMAQFNPLLKEHFFRLSQHFTKIKLSYYLKLSSTYSQRMFEYLCSWRSLDSRIESLETLMKIFSVPKSLCQYSQFKRRILDQAKKEFSEEMLWFDYLPVKEGRVVTAIKFYFSRDIFRSEKVRDEGVKGNNLFLEVVKCRKKKGLECSIKCSSVKCKSKKMKVLCLDF